MTVGIGEIGTMASLKEKAFSTTNPITKTFFMKVILMDNPMEKEFLSSMKDKLNMRVQLSMEKLMEKAFTKILEKILSSMENSEILSLIKDTYM